MFCGCGCYGRVDLCCVLLINVLFLGVCICKKDGEWVFWEWGFYFVWDSGYFLYGLCWGWFVCCLLGYVLFFLCCYLGLNDKNC